MLDDSALLTVTDIKQYIYCPRIIFYERCLPHVRPRTFKMDAGRDAHHDEQRRSVRRSLEKLDVLSGKRKFDVHLTGSTLNLTGTVDEVVYPTQGVPIPVDYKLAKLASRHYKLQLTAYALLLEETLAVTIPKGYLYLIPLRKLVLVNITDELRQEVKATLTAIQTMIQNEEMPPPAETRSHCVSCEFRRFCNDI